MTNEEFSKLKQGDVVRHEPTGSGYIVLSNRAGVPTVIRSIELHTGLDWSHVYTPEPIKVAPVGLTQKVTDLEAAGWKYDETLGNGRWVAPDGTLFSSLSVAHANRNNYPRTVLNKARSFTEARLALRDAGWTNPYGKTWRSPSGDLFDGARAAYAEWSRGDGTGNAL